MGISRADPPAWIESGLHALEEYFRTDAALCRATDRIGSLRPFALEPIRAIEPFPSVVANIASLEHACWSQNGVGYGMDWSYSRYETAHASAAKWREVFTAFGDVLSEQALSDVSFPLDLLDNISASKSHGWSGDQGRNDDYFRSIKEFAAYDNRPIRSEDELKRWLEQSDKAPMTGSELHIEYDAWTRRYTWHNDNGSHRVAAAAVFLQASDAPDYRFRAMVRVRTLCRDTIEKLRSTVRIFLCDDEQAAANAVRDLAERFGLSVQLLRNTTRGAVSSTAIAVFLMNAKDERLAEILTRRVPAHGELTAFLEGLAEGQVVPQWATASGDGSETFVPGRYARSYLAMKPRESVDKPKGC